MWRSSKRLDRPTYWMWVVPLVLGHLLLGLVVAKGASSSIGSIDTGLIVGLAYMLAARFRDIGWPGWIGPTILLGMLGVPFVLLGVAVGNHAVDESMQWFSLYGLVSGLVNLVLLIVAGCMPGSLTQAPRLRTCSSDRASLRMASSE